MGLPVVISGIARYGLYFKHDYLREKVFSVSDQTTVLSRLFFSSDWSNSENESTFQNIKIDTGERFPQDKNSRCDADHVSPHMAVMR